MKTTGFATWTISLLAILTVTGCGLKNEQAAPATEVLKQTYKIDPTGTLRIRHLVGSISIRGADTSELQLEAVKKASSAAQLANLKVSVVAQDDTATITTSFVRQKNKALSLGTGSVEYSLVVPRTIRVTRVDLEDGDVTVDGLLGQDLRINIVDGKLALRNCCGNVHATIANGGIDFSYGDCNSQTLSAVAQLMNGNAALHFPPGASVRVRAETSVGKITNELAETVELNGPTRRVDVSVGNTARSDIKVQVTTGDIRLGRSSIAKAADRGNLQPGSQVATSAP